MIQHSLTRHGCLVYVETGYDLAYRQGQDISIRQRVQVGSTTHQHS